jgi:hypothetical protein
MFHSNPMFWWDSSADGKAVAKRNFLCSGSRNPTTLALEDAATRNRGLDSSNLVGLRRFFPEV